MNPLQQHDSLFPQHHHLSVHAYAYPFPSRRPRLPPFSAAPELVKGQNLRDDCQTFICIREQRQQLATIPHEGFVGWSKVQRNRKVMRARGLQSKGIDSDLH